MTSASRAACINSWAPRRATSSRISGSSRSSANKASILVRIRSVADTRTGAGRDFLLRRLAGREAEPTPVLPIYTGFRTRPNAAQTRIMRSTSSFVGTRRRSSSSLFRHMYGDTSYEFLLLMVAALCGALVSRIRRAAVMVLPSGSSSCGLRLDGGVPRARLAVHPDTDPARPVGGGGGLHPRTACLALRQSSVVPSSAWRMSLTRAAQALRAASARVTRTSQLPA